MHLHVHSATLVFKWNHHHPIAPRRQRFTTSPPPPRALSSRPTSPAPFASRKMLARHGISRSTATSFNSYRARRRQQLLHLERNGISNGGHASTSTAAPDSRSLAPRSSDMGRPHRARPAPRLRAAYGTPEFEAEYHAAIRGEPFSGPRRAGAGTSMAWDRYSQSSDMVGALPTPLGASAKTSCSTSSTEPAPCPCRH